MKNNNFLTKTRSSKLWSLFILLCISFLANKINAQISIATVTVNSASTITSVAALPTAVCTTDGVALTVTGNLGSGAHWQWYSGSCGGTPIGQGVTITVNPVNATTAPITVIYYVISEGGSCAASTCEQVSVTVNPTPVITAPADATFCYGGTTTSITVSGTPSGFSFDISGGAAIGLGDVAGATDVPAFTPINIGTTPVNATITLTPHANGCTGSTVSFTITILPQVTMTTPADVFGCNDAIVSVPAFGGSPSGTTYAWTNNNTGIGLGVSGSGNISFTGAASACTNGVGAITVTPTLISGATCAGTPVNFNITIRPTPNGVLTGGTICEGADAQLLFTASCGNGPFNLGIATNALAPIVAYPGVSSGAAFSIDPDPVVSTTYNLMTITDANGCVAD